MYEWMKKCQEVHWRENCLEVPSPEHLTSVALLTVLPTVTV